ncbi:uncharacterized protein PFL1_02659 [Pseudozyma flocculosa PF-1]|uniref:Uncharacterized protein n=2 Tax=Pseudozyma flocculosa TaxID=84751 RepID=A0A5C3F1Y8_9BASI|nr:uncharacterized protein PFL1_02659 [Pseudozyma flocculosa PF-1]EPQ29986.1 hypothetical protein PFL1_02659 [Pseudozyma flocculosa PF-1]SPO37301.1 uncharacterized protein PSFLO_02774 [Pseudozyma flocculosa]
MSKWLRFVAVLLPIVALTSKASPLPEFDLDALAELPTPTSIPADVAFTVIDAATAVQSILATATPAAAIKDDLLEGAQEAEENAAAPTVSVTTLRKRDEPKSLYPNLPAGNYVDTAQWPAGNFTPAEFQAFSLYSTAANTVSVNGWTKSYTGLKSVRGNMPAVLRINTASAWDPGAMAAKCNTITDCVSFAMWFERTPTVAPSDTVPNPVPGVWIKVLFYGYPLGPADATNEGQWQRKFWRTQAGVTFFNRNNLMSKQVPGFSGPFRLPGAINVTSTQVAANGGIDPQMTKSDPMTGIPDPLVCKALCERYTADPAYFNGIKKNCNQFNIFLLALNGQATGWQCQYYTNVFGAEAATDMGGRDSKGNRVEVIGSWVYNAATQLAPYVRQVVDCGRKNINHSGNCTQVQDWSVFMGDDADTLGFKSFPTQFDFTARTINGWKISATTGQFKNDPQGACSTYPGAGAPGNVALPAGSHYMECFSGVTWTAQGFTADLISMTVLKPGVITAYRGAFKVGTFNAPAGRDVKLPDTWTGITAFSNTGILRFTDFKMVRRYSSVPFKKRSEIVVSFETRDDAAAAAAASTDGAVGGEATTTILGYEGVIYELPGDCQAGFAAQGQCGRVVTDPAVSTLDMANLEVITASPDDAAGAPASVDATPAADPAATTDTSTASA